MLRASPPLTVGQASHYYKSEFSRGDYYTERESEGIVASRWHGRGAGQLGLAGRVSADHFARLLEGRDAAGRTVLVAHREGLSERRAGWDVTISPHKSVSLTALVGGDRRLLDAHDRAVEKALCELERHARSWVHGGRDVETTGLVVAASFRHETSRALDPQLHSHCVILNITRRADGKWRAVDARGIFRAQRLAREIYETELGKELRGLGYEVATYRDGRAGRDRAVGIAGFDPEHLGHFSKRAREIEKVLHSHGLKSRLHGSRVTVATRNAKEKGVDREALLRNWRTAAREIGLRFPKWERERVVTPGRLDPARELEISTWVAVNGAVQHLSERRAVFSLAELEKEALTRGRDLGVTIDHVRKNIFGRDDLVLADPGDAVVARVTTARAIEDERWLLGAVHRGRGRGPTLAADGRVSRLGEDQLRVARHMLGNPDRLVAVEGRAGAGKTTALAYVRERAEGAGWKLRGFAPTTTAVAMLRDGGIQAVTVAAALKENLSVNNQTPELWIIDEAGLLSTRQARELLDRAEKVSAKVALVGDRQQHHAVEAGSPFALLIDRAAIATERLDVIRRQKEKGLRETVRAASEAGGAGRAVQLLEQAGRVMEIADTRARHEAIARDFVADGGRGVVIAPSNAERTDLNRRIREALIEAGRVERRSVKATVVVRQDLTAEQHGRVASYSVGDVLHFVRGGGRIEAGERARVVSLDDKKNLLRLQLESGLARVINPKERRGFEVERVDQRRFAVGDRIQFRERNRSLDVANGSIGTIKKLDSERGIATVDVAGKRVRLDLNEAMALDHAYAVTSHRSQGLSRERVYLTVDTGRSEELVNRRQFYVSVSRAVEDARVYTDDRGALARVVSREQGRESALSLMERVPPKESRVALLRRETPLDLARRNEDPRGRGPAEERVAPEREGTFRPVADGRGTCGDAAHLPGRPGGQLPLWRDHEHHVGPEGTARSERREERPFGDEPLRGYAAGARALSREEIARSVDLQRRYATEYASILRVISDHEVAKEAARVNVSALLLGQPQIVPHDRRFNADDLREAITCGGEDLGAIRRAVSRLLDRSTPGIERLIGPRVRDLGPER
jgi:conjugative relaxase-like TrwC/TraI family protein